VWRLIAGLRDHGATVLLTTHYLEEAEALADRLEIMHAGQIVRSGTPTEIAAGHPSTISVRGTVGLPPELGRVVHEHGHTTLHTPTLQETLTDLLLWAREHELALEGLEARSPSLESVFLAIADEPILEGSFA
jgi:ABC-2 type transport system ATP-binding protein